MKEPKFTENFGDKRRLGVRQMWCGDLHINLGGLACVCVLGGGVAHLESWVVQNTLKPFVPLGPRLIECSLGAGSKSQ